MVRNRAGCSSSVGIASRILSWYASRKSNNRQDEYHLGHSDCSCPTDCFQPTVRLADVFYA